MLTDWLDEEDAMTSLESEAKKRPKRRRAKRDVEGLGKKLDEKQQKNIERQQRCGDMMYIYNIYMP